MLKEGDRVPDEGFLLMRWNWSSFPYMVIDLSRLGELIRFTKYDTREEAVLELEAAGKEFWEIPFEASLYDMRRERIVRKIS